MVWLVPAGSESVCLCRERCLQNSSCGLRSTPRLSTGSARMYFEGEMCRRHNVLYHCYADDIQLYCAAEGSEDLAAKLSSINECIDELKSWMGCNMLKLNSEKTEFIIFSSKKSPGRNITPSLPWHLRDINISSHVRSLGVIFDSALSFAKHTDYIIKSCNFYIRNIGPIRQFLSKKACGKLVVALVTPPHPLTIATLY